MILLSKYISLKNIHQATAYRRIERGEILSVKQGKDTYIIDESLEKIPQGKELKTLIHLKRKEWNAIILNASIRDKVTDEIDTLKRADAIKEITADQINYAKRGIEIKGYSDKSIYRKITKGEVDHKTRSDAGTYKNEIIIETLETKLLPLACFYYLNAADKDIYQTVDRVYDHAKNDEYYYELAVIPRGTMIRVLTNEIHSRGIKELQEYNKHYNTWMAKRAYATGSLTDDIEYGSIIIGDDHKADVYKVLAWNNLKKAFENKTLYTWVWIEAKTQRILSIVIKTSEINTDDLKRSLIEAVSVMGRPSQYVLVDNGIARSEEFISSCNKLRVKLSFAKAHTPTEKSPVERLFGYVKKEHDIYRNNYTGSNHAKEGVHKTLSLTPDRADYTFEDFRESLLQYISGFYETRPRQRRVDNKKVRISIREMWDMYWKTFQPDYPTNEECANAYMCEATGVFDNKIKFMDDFYMPATFHGLGCNGRTYRIMYNPHNPDAIYLYATKYFQDKTTGTEYYPGKLVMQCDRIRAMAPVAKREAVKRNQKLRTKAVAMLNDSITEQVLINDTTLVEKINSTVDANGKVKSVRTAVYKRVKEMIETAIPGNDISKIIEQEADAGKFELDDLLNDEVFAGEELQASLNETLDEERMLNELNNLKI